MENSNDLETSVQFFKRYRRRKIYVLNIILIGWGREAGGGGGNNTNYLTKSICNCILSK